MTTENTPEKPHAESAGRLAPDLLAEYIDRLNAGEMLDKEKIAREHPDCAARLLEDLEAFRAFGANSGPQQPLASLGDYTLRRQIGRGGMGIVYDAWQNSLERQVALKVLPLGVAADARASTRFLREAQIAGKLSHTRIVPVYASGVEGGTPWYAMEYVEGETLAATLATISEAEPDMETPFGRKNDVLYFVSLSEAFAGVADGLQHAHSRGVIHRDIKPSNLILDGEGRLRILDFGLARLEGQEALTLSGDLMGTVLYMSPEQAMVKRVAIDHRTDVYSLGATLYETLTGEPPIRGRDHHDTLSRIVARDPRPPRQLNPQVPVDLDTVVLKCLRKDPGDRYGTAEALGQDLRRFARGDAVEARPQSKWERWSRTLWSHRVAVLLSLGGGLLLVVMLAVGLALLRNAYSVLDARSREAADELYVSDLIAVERAWANGNVRTARELLMRHMPGRGEEDRRCFAWRYYHNLTRGSEQTLEAGYPVTSVDFSPDGKWLVSGSGRSPRRIGLPLRDTVTLWDAQSGREVRTLSEGKEFYQGTAWSRDSSLVAAGGAGAPRVWRVPSGEPLAHLEVLGERRFWKRPVFRPGPGGALLAAPGLTRDIGLWDFETGAPRLLDYPSKVHALDFSPDGLLLAVAGRDVTLLELASGATLPPFEEGDTFGGTSGYVGDVKFSPDGRLLAATRLELEPPHVRVWDVSTGSRVADLEHPMATSVAFSPDSAMLAAASRENVVALWTGGAFTPFATFKGHSNHVEDLEFSPDGTRLATASFDESMKLWRVTSGPPAVIDWPEAHHSQQRNARLAFLRDGRTLLGSSRHGFRFWNIESVELLETVDAPHYATAAALARDDSFVAFVPGDGRIHVYERASGRRREFLCPVAKSVLFLEVYPEGDRALVVTRKSVHEVDLADGASRGDPLLLPRRITRATLASDGRHFAAGFQGGEVRVWELSGRSLAVETRWPSSVTRVEFSHDAKLLAVAREDASLRVHDLTSGIVQHIEGHGTAPNELCFAPDGETLFSADGRGLVRVWDLRTGREKAVLREASGAWIRDLAVSPSGEILAALADTGHIHLWRAPVGGSAHDPP